MQSLEADGSLLGIFPDETFAETTVQLRRGDRVFIYTDGIEVAFADDQSNDLQRWREELFARRHLSTKDLISEFAAHLDRETGSIAPKDDLTMVVLEVKP